MYVLSCAGLETFVLNIADPMDMVQMSYRVSQIEQKYSRSLYGIVIVDTYQTGDVSVSSSQWTKQKKLQKKLQLSNSGNESSVITPQEKEQLFHMNTRDYFDLHEMHTKYQNVFQGPYRLLQVCFASSSIVIFSHEILIVFLIVQCRTGVSRPR
jgi:hypothetical protein